MCGRFSLGALHAENVTAAYPYIQPARFIDQNAFHPRYNIAPRSCAPIIRRSSSSAAAAAPGVLVIHTARWGIIPHWSKHDDNPLATINARGEALIDGSSALWNSLRSTRRCLVPCDGYYEFLSKPGSHKIPHFTRHPDARVMLLAGMWDKVLLEGHKDPLYTFTIVTTSANDQLAWLHDRMPVILSSQSDIETWLGGAPWSPEVAQLVHPYQHPLECYAVPAEVGKVGTDDPSFIQPVSQRKDGIAAMFGRQRAKSSSKSQPSPNKPTTGKSEALEDDDEAMEMSPPPTTSKRIKSDEDDSKSPYRPGKRHAPEPTAEWSNAGPSPKKKVHIEDKTQIPAKSSPRKSTGTGRTIAITSPSKAKAKAKSSKTGTITAFFDKK
ncbi:hypothetical protein BOTBODRAFT_135976 [Botryobasidium botryosum FD-172 SS1]|uniref:DUF159-domain-containing protein n=1 Tax=Botryobasidium botryosum (strain FD-172 SS1) TaxID=930990 RepID=A0A067MH48_BOTB1|nr:hypothetical protein BOTBODRAFT_135976 [Botryobasidium botryosum FD-172 SS1]